MTANCDAFTHEELRECPEKCGEEKFCTWASWQDWGPCTANCGEARRPRRRYLTLSDTPSDPPAPYLATMTDIPRHYLTHSDTPTELYLQPAELAKKYQELQQTKEHLQKFYAHGIILCFAAGCLCFALVLAGVRVGSGVTSRRQQTVMQEAHLTPTYKHLHEVNETEVKVPLVMN